MDNKNNVNSNFRKIITSIDIGSKNLGLCVVEKNGNNDLIPFPLFIGKFNLSKKKNQVDSKIQIKKEVKIKSETIKSETIKSETIKSKTIKSGINKKKVVKNVDLKIVSYNINDYLGDSIFHEVDEVIIEKQYTPGKIQGLSGQNNRMNSISYMIFQYFVDESRTRGLPKNIVFVQPSARFNLKRLPDSFDPEELDKNKRKEKRYRKKLSIDLTKSYFNEMLKDENKDLYNQDKVKEYLQIISDDKKKKGEDMCDTYLSAIQYLQR